MKRSEYSILGTSNFSNHARTKGDASPAQWLFGSNAVQDLVHFEGWLLKMEGAALDENAKAEYRGLPAPTATATIEEAEEVKDAAVLKELENPVEITSTVPPGHLLHLLKEHVAEKPPQPEAEAEATPPSASAAGEAPGALATPEAAESAEAEQSEASESKEAEPVKGADKEAQAAEAESERQAKRAQAEIDKANEAAEAAEAERRKAKTTPPAKERNDGNGNGKRQKRLSFDA